MNKKTTTLNIAMGLLLVNGVFANEPKTEIENFDINSIEYIEEETEIDLGFNAADYLPEGFDPHKLYVDLDAVHYLQEELIDSFDAKRYLPKDFDAYAYPTDVQSINYIDENDFISLDIDAENHLPEGFDVYIVKK